MFSRRRIFLNVSLITVLTVTQGFSAAMLFAGDAAVGLKVKSAAFMPGSEIPKLYACQGTNVSPPLNWEGVPEGAQSLALIVDDPDAPAGTWVHWVVFNIAPDKGGLPEAMPKLEKLEDGTEQAVTSFRKVGYGGPCPPSGTHRYFFRLYALDAKLSLAKGASRKDLEEAMAGHILAEGELMGTYKKS